MSPDELGEIAFRLAMTILDGVPNPRPEDLERAIVGAAGSLTAMGRAEPLDHEGLRRRLEANVAVYVGDQRALGDDTDHVEWLNRRRPEIDWRFWRAYRRWQVTNGLPHEVAGRLDNITDDILGRLEDPTRSGPWDRRGLVVGQVQSGKTSNYTGLICKAADAGYKLIVVLAGMHNSLRSQTQRRLDEGFLGLDSRTAIGFTGTNRHIGVGAGGAHHPSAWTMTSSEQSGDFKRNVATQIAGRLGGDPVVLVIKKNASIMRNLTEWIATSNGRPAPHTGRLVVSGLPLLIIDDEADNASVNTKEIEFETDEDGRVVAETDPAAINGLIRRFLHSFEQSIYVGYTATPFANIFIDEEQRSPEYGEDLFPRSFILRIPPPSNYLGPAEVFGVAAVDDPTGQGRTARPIVRSIGDHEDWIPDRHRKDWIPGAVPGSLLDAMGAFLLTCAARAARGQEHVHNSMLVHVTRFVDVQALVKDQVAGELESMRERLRYGEGDSPTRLRRRLRELWERDFEPTTAAMEHLEDIPPLGWEDVETHLADAAARIEVRAINGSAGDALEYVDHPDGVSVIAVGGDKLSRGLTLEGLSISYYLRASRMYDTLMQMGRWFGYRPGYGDLCRLYTTAELRDWYRDITVANEELLTKFDEMAAVRANPEAFALYVRQSPAGLLITARAKMRNGRRMQLAFAGDVIETINFGRETDPHIANLERLGPWLEEQSRRGREAPDRKRDNILWRRVPGADVAGLLEGWQNAPNARRAQATLLARYIRSRLRDDELEDWTVVLIDNATARRRLGIVGRTVGLTLRAEHPPESEAATYNIRRLLSPPDEWIDLDTEERARALERTIYLWERGGVRSRTRPTEPNGPGVRFARPPTRALLLLYPLDPEPSGLADFEGCIPAFGVSFPNSARARPIDYVVPNRYWEEFVAA